MQYSGVESPSATGILNRSAQLAGRARQGRGRGQKFEGFGTSNSEYHPLALPSHDAPTHLARPAFPARRALLSSRVSRASILLATPRGFE